MVKRSAFVLGGLLMFSSVACADEVAVADVSNESSGHSSTGFDSESPSSWENFHIGFGLAGSLLSSSISADSSGNADNLPLDTEGYVYNYSELSQISGSPSAQHSFVSVEAGYDLQPAERVVVGGFGAIELGSEGNSIDGDGSWEIRGADSSSEAGVIAVRSDLSREGTWAAGARLGYLVEPELLVYGMLGYEKSRFTLHSSASVVGLAELDPTLLSVQDTRWLGAGFIGAGVEALLDGNVSVRAEYRLANYGDMSVFDDESMIVDRYDDIEGDRQISGMASSIVSQSIRVVLSYRFQ